MNLGKLWQRFRIPVLVGIGGLSALWSISARREAQQAAAAAAAGAQPTVVAGDTSGAYQAGLSAGAGLYGQAVAQGLGPTESALGLAGVAVQTATGLAAGVTGDYLGFGSNLVGALSGLFSPVPAPVTQPPATGGGSPTPSPAPAPTPSTVTETFSHYEAVFGPGTVILYGPAPSHEPRRTLNMTASNRGKVQPITTPWNYYKITSGGYSGWHLVPGKSGPVSVFRVFRRDDGTTRQVPV